MNKGVIGILTAILVLIVLSSVSVSAYDVPKHSSRLSRILYDYYDYDFFMHMNVRNEGSKNIENGKVIIFIPELDFYWRTSSFDIQSGEKHGKFVFPDVYDIPPGDYLVKVMFSSDYARDWKYIWITVE